MKTHNNAPSFQEFSEVRFGNLSEADSIGASGEGYLNPYYSLGDRGSLSRLSILVSSEGRTFLDLDTSHGIVDNFTGDGSVIYSGGTTPGTRGAASKALPLSLQRIHFIGTEGKSGIPHEYFTYVLCGSPIKTNPAIKVTKALSAVDGLGATTDTKTTDILEEQGSRVPWGASTAGVGDNNFPNRVIIGAPHTGNIITHVDVVTDGCIQKLQIKTGLGYVFGEGELIEKEIGYTTEAILKAFESSATKIHDIFADLQDCACDPIPGITDGSTGVSGDLIAECLCNLDISTLEPETSNTGWICDLVL